MRDPKKFSTNSHSNLPNQFPGHVKTDKRKIGTINGSWGPIFRVSLDLIIHSHSKGGGRAGLSDVLSFIGSGGRIPRIRVNDYIHIILYYKGMKPLRKRFKYEMKTWYNIIIEQKKHNSKVRKVFLKFS